MEYEEQNGWELGKPVMAPDLIAPLCKHVYHNHPTGCHRGCKFHYWYEALDPNKEVWIIYFSMNLDPLWNKIRKNQPQFSDRQVENMRYWNGTKNKYLRIMEQEFLKEHPGPWARALNRGPGRTNYTFGIWYTKTMEQIGINLQWPPGPFPMTIQFLGRPIRDDLAPEFILK